MWTASLACHCRLTCIDYEKLLKIWALQTIQLWLALITLTVHKSISRQKKMHPRYQWAWMSGNMKSIAAKIQYAEIPIHI